MTEASNVALAHDLKALGAATIYEAQGQRGAIDPMVKALAPSMRLAGRAFTVDAGPADNLMLHLALLKIRPGDVLVVDAHGEMNAGPWATF